jgi:uncharacterized protein (DUF58 family)
MNLYPTRGAIILAVGGAPVALLVAAAAPGLWIVGAGWILLVAGLLVADAALAAPAAAVRLRVAAPDLIGVGREAVLRIEAEFERLAPRKVELAVGADERLELPVERQSRPVRDGAAWAEFPLRARRRGEGRLSGVWARWRGPLGLVWRQRREAPPAVVPVTPDVEGVRKEGLALFTRDAPVGMRAKLDVGEGAEFHALKEFQTGMDLRAIDWKQSARHGRLVGREYRAERNHNIILALDSGRLMSAPIAGQARIDHAINAALILAFVGLKLGDRVGLFAFDARPRVASGTTAGVRAFPTLQRLAAQVDYSTEETNFTLGLTSLAGRLDRRSLVVVFTDFADPTSAALMVEHLGRLARTHLIVLVTFRDEELEALAAAEPEVPDDVSRAVVASRLLKERERVLGELRRLGVQILQAPAGQIGPSLINRYLDVKRRELV